MENEFGPMESVVGSGGKPYAHWAAQMAVGTNAGVPWVMCKQDDAPDPVVCSVALARTLQWLMCRSTVEYLDFLCAA